MKKNLCEWKTWDGLARFPHIIQDFIGRLDDRTFLLEMRFKYQNKTYYLPSHQNGFHVTI